MNQVAGVKQANNECIIASGMTLQPISSPCCVCNFPFDILTFIFLCYNKATKTSGLRPMEQKDTKAVQELINTYLKQFNLAPVMDEDEVAHWFLPRDHIIDTFVVEVKHSLTTSGM